LIHWLEPDDPFPAQADALDDPPGLLAAGGDLSATRLIDAYRHGIFPWFSEGQPPLWWCPDPRMVLFTAQLRVSHSLAKRLKRGSLPGGPVQVRCDTSFEAVMRACAAPRAFQDGTWIVEPMIDAYLELHRRGIAHSVETWMNGKLVGGLYGLSLGRMFFGESMFTREPDASKIALAHLTSFLHDNDIPMIDCQQQTSHLASLGARPVRRVWFIEQVATLVDQPALPSWPQILTWNGHRAPL
jgi:leucyl/phenylalanyl-tRNA---protein transferase